MESLSVLNIQQAIDDVGYFAKNAKLPMPGGDQVTPDTSPWIMIGGSYSGVLTSILMLVNFLLNSLRRIDQLDYGDVHSVRFSY